MENRRIQSNLISFIQQNLINVLKLQLELPKIPDLEQLLYKYSEINVEQLEVFRTQIAQSVLYSKVLQDEFLTLIDALIINNLLKATPMTIESLEKCFQNLQSLQKRKDFDNLFTLYSLESSIIHSLNFVEDLVSLESWLKAINTLKVLFEYDVSSLKNFFETKIVQIVISELSLKKENIYQILAFIAEMEKQDFDLQNVKTIAIDSALYYISDLEEAKNKQKISEVI